MMSDSKNEFLILPETNHLIKILVFDRCRAISPNYASENHLRLIN